MHNPKLFFLSASILLLNACSGEPATVDPLQRDLDSLRTLTNGFQTLAAGQAAGFNVKITDCMSDAEGAMGFHYGNAARIDGTVKQLEPEVLMYEPAANGSLRLVGVEYVVPLNAWTAPAPPQLFGQTFQRNEMFQVWALHAWIWKDNPRGTFASWNPNVSCAQVGA
jgi:hypothetical protein